ncbi:MAG: Hpt domain-containing protein [Planctomycetota bacterium]
MELYEELIEDFRASSLENLDVVEPLLQGLQRRGSATSGEYSSIFRAVHTIQGSAGFIGLDDIQRLAQASESLLQRLREGEVEYQPRVAETLLESVDDLRRMLRAPSGPADFPQQTFDELHDLTHPDDDESPATEAGPRLRFGEVAVDLGFLTPGDVDQLLEVQRQSDTPRSLGAVGRELGLLDEAAVKTIAAEQTLRLLMSGHKLQIPGLATPADAAPEESAAPAKRSPAPRAQFSTPAETAVVSARVLDEGVGLVSEIDRMRREIEDRLDEGALESVSVLLDRLRALSRELRLELVDSRTGTLADVYWAVERAANAAADEGAIDLKPRFSGEALEVDHAILVRLREPLERLTDHALTSLAPNSSARLELHGCRDTDSLTLEFECAGPTTGRGSASLEAVRGAFERLGLGFEVAERQGRRAARIEIPL